ncbi:Mrp/NBP35 family ATP-binding protein [Melioribacter sp. OK-6-Me]|uniref:Mrp/NBP35 family ATP-binding protein n=1 Tax=unclassified Melioribacter TaxID=2627329 RepID=UPI003EDA16A2
MTEQEKLKAFEEEQKRINENISKIKHRIAVFSGKGGVGKTTVSVNIAYSLQLDGFSTGILDADITGPNVAKMLGVDSELIVLDSKMIPFEKYGTKMISIASLIRNGQPVIWRGPMRSKVINQFLADVEWGELDYLIADLPPGTGDEILTIAQEMKPDCAVIVTTPQEVSVIDAERAINMAKELEIPFIGVVENMAGFVCPHCNAVIEIFGTGGGEKLANKYELPFLGSIPINIDARILGDKGKPIVLEKPKCEVTNAFKSIVNLIEEHYKKETKIN